MTSDIKRSAYWLNLIIIVNKYQGSFMSVIFM